MHWPPYFNETIEAGDVVMLRGGVDELASLQDELKLKLFNEERFDAKSMQFYELAVAPQSARPRGSASLASLVAVSR